ncbi:MAG: hypothetical protein KH020_10755 [Clostridiales bacterium]|nr:hypothetical protein [Clostridiales bacterium]
MLDRNKIEKELIKMGANPSLNGFRLVPDALNAIDKEIQNGNIKITCIYNDVGKLNNCTGTSAGRNLRHFFEHLRRKPNGVEIIGEKPTNKEALFLLYYKFKGESKNEED